MSLALTAAMSLTAIKTLSDTYLASGKKAVTVDGLNAAWSLNGESSVPVSEVAPFQQALSGGAATLDLTDLDGINGGPVNGLGLKAQFVILRNPDTNANAIVIEPGDSNAYNLFGPTFKVTLQPGQAIMAALEEQAPDVASGAKNIKLTGTGSQVLEIELVFG